MHDTDFDPDGARLPIKIDTTTNGEFAPRPLTRAQSVANAYAHARADELARKRGQSRRAFLTSASGAAATLIAFNEAHAAFGQRGGRFDIAQAAEIDEDAAQEALAKTEFIIDVQTHCVDPAGSWAQGEDGELWRRNLLQLFGQSAECRQGFECYSARQLLKDVYLDSDTDVAVVSALWGARGQNPTPTDYAAEARAIIEEAEGRDRCLIHGGVLPNEDGALELMDEQVSVHRVNAWKLYPQWGPEGRGYHMDDPVGIAFLEKARALGVTTVAAHRGLPLPNLEYEYSHPGDIARAAAAYPDMTFLCYHSGFEPDVEEGPYDPGNDSGVDRLIRAHAEAGFAPNQGNLYAEIGSAWREKMSRPDEAAHMIGKLLVRFGADRICWGTDSVWYGSPQDQILAFRTFQISPEFQERFGYPRITAEMKAKIFGLNGARVYGLDVEALQETRARDRLGRIKHGYAPAPNPSFATRGPRTRREFLALMDRTGGRPG